MKLVTLVASISLCAVAFAEAVLVSADARLKDGSTVKGEFLTKDICGSTLFAPELKLDSGNVKSVAFSGTNGEAKVELSNSDKFAMKVSNASFAIKSLLGDLNIPRESVRSIELHKKRNATASATDGLVFHCTFDDEASIVSPAVGPGGVVCSRDFVEGQVGKAVRVPKGGSAGFFTLPPGVLCEDGCIEFWAKLEPRREYFGDCDPRMMIIKSPAGWFSVEYSSNNGNGLGGFFVRNFGFNYIKGGSCGRYYKYSDVIEKVEEWHHYAFSWTESTLTTYIDGKKVEGMSKCDGVATDVKKLLNGSAVMGLPNSNISVHNTEPNSPFAMDELKIWNYAKSEFDF